MTNETAFCLFVMFAIFLVVGFLVGVNWQRHVNRVVVVKLDIAQKALIEKQGQLNQANRKLEQIDKEFQQGRWQAV